MSSSIKFQCVDDSGNPIFLVDSTNGIYHKNTRNSSNSSTGALLLYGGLSINSTTNSINVSNGGVLTVAGGASFSKDVYIGGDLRVYGSQTLGNVTLSNLTSGNILTNNINLGISNIYSGSFTSTNNQSIASNVTGLSFPNATINSFVINLTVNITTNSNNYYETFTLEGTQTNSGWSLFSTKYGDNSGIVFSITSSGQIQYTSTNISNFTNGLFNFSVNQITKTGNYSYVNTTSQGTLVADVIQILSTNDSNLGVNNGGLYLLGGATILKSLYVGTSISSSNAILTNITSNTLNVSNVSSSVITAGTVNVNTRLSSANISSSIITTGTLNSTLISSANIGASLISSGTLNASTLVSSANISASLISTGTLNAATSISSATLNLSSGLTAATARITGPGGIGTNGSVLITGQDSFGHSLYVASVASQKRVVFNNTGSVGNIFAYDYGSLASQNIALQGFGGNVGIGTSSPTSTLRVLGGISTNFNSTIISEGLHLQWNRSNADGESWIINQKGGGTANSGIRFGRADTSNSVTELMRILDSGNVGIATGTPESKLHVNGAITIEGESITTGQVDSSNLTQTYLHFKQNGSSNDWAYLRQIGSTNNYLMALDIHDDGDEQGFCIRSITSTATPDTVNERFRVQANGNVGIGTSSPGTTLDVSGTFRATTSVTSGGLFATNVTAINIVATTISAGTIVGNISSANVSASLITTGILNAATLISSANITASLITTGTLNVSTLVSSTNISASLITAGTLVATTRVSSANLNSSAISTGSINLTSSDTWQTSLNITNNNNNTWQFNVGGSTNNAVGVNNIGLFGNSGYRMVVTSTGNVGIGNDNPGFKLDVSGTARFTTSVTSGALYATNITATNIVGTNISAGTILGNISSANISASVVTTGTMLSSNIVLSGSSSQVVTYPLTNGLENAFAYYNNTLASGDATRWVVGLNVQTGIGNYGFWNSSLNRPALMMTSTGNIGIGTTVPGSTLDVSGTINASTSISSANISSAIISTGTLVGSTININGTTRIINTSPSSRGTLIVAGPGSTTYLPAITTIGQLMTMYGPGGANIFSNIDLSTFEPTPSAMNLPAVRISMQDLGANNSSFNILTKNAGSTGTMASRMFIDGSGNIGLGTTSPGESLDIRGNLRIGNNTQSNYISFTGTYGDGIGEYSHTFIGERLYGGTEQSELLLFKGNDTGTSVAGPDRIRLLAAEHRFDTYISPVIGSFENVGSTVASNRMIINSAGNVGIGTILPICNLDVTGTIRATTSLTSAALFATNITGTNIVGTNISTGILNATTSVTSASLFSLNITSSNIVGTNVSTATLLASTRVSSANIAALLITTGTLNAATLVSSANIAASIITTGTLNASTRVSSANLNTSIISTGTLIAINNSNTLGSLYTTNGNVGIGTVSPQAELHIQATNLTSLLSTWSGAGSSTNIDFSYDNSTQFGTAASARIKVSDNDYGADVFIQNRDQGSDNSNMNTRLFIGATGDIGIGTETPSTKVEIVTAQGSGFRHTGNVLQLFPFPQIYTTQLETYIDINGGWLRTSTNNAINFAVNSGNPSMTINTNGSIGINTTAPAAATKLQVIGNVGIGTADAGTDGKAGLLDIRASSVAYHSTTLMSAYAQTITHNVSANGSLGIAFGIVSAASNPVYTPGASIIHERTGANSVGLLHFCTKSGTAATAANLIRMTIQTSGNVGIGTTAPDYKLQSTSTISVTPIPSSGEARYHLYNGGAQAEWKVGQKSSSRHDYCITKVVSGAETDYLSVGINGNVGIGTNNPGTTLEVRTASSAKGIRHSDGTIQFDTYVGGSVSGGYLQTTSNHPLVLTVNDGTPKLTVNTNGNIGIGTNTPAYQLQLSSDSAAKPSTNTWTVSSDERLKTNIQLADLDICYNIIKNLPLKRYTWKDDIYTAEEVPDRTKLGWIAQDVESIIPKAVEKVAMLGYEDCRTLNSDQIIASLYGCVQKLITLNESRDEQINNLNEKIHKIVSEKEIQNIEIRQLMERINLLEDRIYNNFTV